MKTIQHLKQKGTRGCSLSMSPSHQAINCTKKGYQLCEISCRYCQEKNILVNNTYHVVVCRKNQKNEFVNIGSKIKSCLPDECFPWRSATQYITSKTSIKCKDTRSIHTFISPSYPKSDTIENLRIIPNTSLNEHNLHQSSEKPMD